MAIGDAIGIETARVGIKRAIAFELAGNVNDLQIKFNEEKSEVAITRDPQARHRELLVVKGPFGSLAKAVESVRKILTAIKDSVNSVSPEPCLLTDELIGEWGKGL